MPIIVLIIKAAYIHLGENVIFISGILHFGPRGPLNFGWQVRLGIVFYQCIHQASYKKCQCQFLLSAYVCRFDYSQVWFFESRYLVAQAGRTYLIELYLEMLSLKNTSSALILMPPSYFLLGNNNIVFVDNIQ